jgi:hypothetical protein
MLGKRAVAFVLSFEFEVFPQISPEWNTE